MGPREPCALPGVRAAGDPNPVNVNYGLELNLPASGQSQAAVAAKIVAGALDFKKLLDR